ncbi:MAG: hypothetical protein IMZ75_12070 [Actinobacteria bacterium]|nr:hypothetical protein [Actinomycetota bacterium]
MKIRHAGAIAFLMMLTAIFAGCGDDTKTTTTTGATLTEADAALDPCNLVTKTDIAAIMGEPVANRQYTEISGGKSCSYTTVQQPPRIAMLTIIAPCSMADFSNLPATNSEMVAGVGMHAMWDKAVLTVHTMNNSCLMVSGGGTPRGADPTDDKPALENARKVALKLIDGGA